MPPVNTVSNSHPSFLSGGGEMGELTRNFNWENTPLGAPELWPSSLKTTLSIVLSSKFPMFLFWGPDLMCFYNDAYRPSLGSDGKHPSILGNPAAQAWPEIWHIIKPMIEGVMAGGESTWSEDQLIPFYRNGKIEDIYWTFSYSPVKSESGEVSGVLTTCTETTSKVIAFRELAETESQLKLMIADLASSEYRFRFLVQVAPVAISILTGRELTIESANDMILKVWGKTREVIGKRLEDALPELKEQAFLTILDDVYTSRQPFHGREFKALLEHDGELQEFYFDFIFQPVYDDKNVGAIFVVAIDVTRQVKGQKELEAAFEQARLSKEAAELGIFDLDIVNGTMEWDDRCRELFGIDHQGAVTYENDFLTGLHPDDHERVTTLIENVLVKSVSNGDYDVDYRTIDRKDSRVRWVRAKGKVYFNDHDAPIRFIGSVLDTTDQKQHEIQLQESAERLEIMNQVIQTISEELDLNKILQKITDVTRHLTGAAFGAFFYNTTGEHGESLKLHSLAGVSRESFEQSGVPWNSALFHKAFSGEGIVRIGDISTDPYYGKTYITDESPKKDLCVVSYLAVPVISRSGFIIGGLFFGHREPAVFTQEHEMLVASIAAQSAIGIDNAKLYEEVKALNAKKDEFIGLASHELKTPLTSINGYLQIISRIIADEKSKKFVDKTRRQAQKLTMLVEDLLDISKIEAGKLQLTMENFDLFPILEDALDLARHLTDKYEIILETKRGTVRSSVRCPAY